MTEYDKRVKDCWNLSGNIYIVKMIDDAGFQDEVKKIKHHDSSLRCCCIIIQ